MVKPWSSGKDEQQYQRRLRAAVGIVRAESCGRDKAAKRATCGKSYGGNEEWGTSEFPPSDVPRKGTQHSSADWRNLS